MSEITKLYENAGVKLDCCKYAKYGYEGEEGPWYYCKKEGRECWTYPHGDADCVEKGYPSFTAEKQIELIKWLASKQYAKYTTSLLINIRDTVRFSGGLIAGVCTLNVGYDKQDKEFENALAGLINEMWQDLTKEEKEQIRSILNG